MKRTLSILLCIAMLMSMAVIGTSAVEDTGEERWDASLVSEENRKTEITFSLDKDSYKPGDTVEVTAHVDSMWGDLSIPGRMPGFDQGFLPGMYGVGSIQTCLIYDTNIFTIPKGIKNLFRTSTITNADVATYDATPVKMAQTLNEQGKGYISVIMTAGNALNADEDAYAALGGSGDFFTAYFKIADDAPAGEYEFIVGAYTFADGSPSFETTDTFYGVDYTRKNNCFNYNSEDIEMTYNIPKIVVEGGSTSGGTTDTPEPDPMEISLTAPTNDFVKDDIVNVDLVVKNNEGINADTIDSSFSFDNTALKLVNVTTDIPGYTVSPIDYDKVNALGKFEDLGKAATFACTVEGENIYSEDGTILTLQFQVLGTAQGGDTAITGTSIMGATYNTSVKIAGTHTHSFDDVITAPTCVNKGYTDKVCSCGLTFEKVSETSATGHTPSTKPEDTVTVPATCTENGRVVVLCSVCGNPASITQTPALGHDWKESDVAVSCTQDGYHLKKCERCNEEEKSNIVPMLEHKNPDGSDAYGEPFVHIKPTTNSLGYIGRECALCKNIWDYEAIPMLEIMKGDTNMDGKIDINDAINTLKYLANWTGLYFSVENADTFVDGRISIFDVERILKYVAGWKGPDGNPISLDYHPKAN